jgi:hypothetical protein
MRNLERERMGYWKERREVSKIMECGSAIHVNA